MTSPATNSPTDALSAFASRHIGPAPDDVSQMLEVIGKPSLEAMLATAVPSGIVTHESLAIAAATSEADVLEQLNGFASRNTVVKSMIGMGYYGTWMPTVIRRNVLENPGWYTAYTPYQPEISQGRLEALLNFQTMVSDLTGQPIAGASLLDEATAAAEAMTLMRRASKAPADAVLVLDRHLFPQTQAVVATRATPLGLKVVVGDLEGVGDEAALMDLTGGLAVFGAIVQYPGVDGRVRDFRALGEALHANGALLCAAADLLSLTLLTPPGEWGADVVVGSTQRFGVPMGFGGPHAGYMSVRSGLERTLPGRLVGVSKDSAGAPAFRLALQTREQHIRRDKATSNICTSQVLLAVLASMYAVYHGPDGLRAIAQRVHGLAASLAQQLRRGGLTVPGDFFDTLTISVPGRAQEVMRAARERGIDVWLADEDTIFVSVDETTTASDVESVVRACDVAVGEASPGGEHRSELPHGLLRESPFLTHPVFQSHHSETSMLRYLRQLCDRDFALDRGMIPLGSCTMKLNATTEMLPITWPGFAELHPFAPADNTVGFRELIDTLCSWLADITGYDAVSVQPNAGSQGELAGLLAIREYHLARGDEQRTVCLIPASAHGTNAASAVMAGMRVVVVGTAPDGTIDMSDLSDKVGEHRSELAAIMVTYPSTHGVYEASITDLCAMIHEAGGQVYVDGANLNALVGIARPGEFGADVSHLNLHKTFAIPHGGGGPGVGPIGVRKHLAPFLPNHPLDDSAGPPTGVGPISGAPYGSAGVLPISWAYIKLMGGPGLIRATQVAVLNANYVAARLRHAFPVLYAGKDGLVAHECILDLREITKRSGVSVDDVAKRLIDYGFHAPTMSFPVPGTLMVEPTESEDKAELDRFCDAMLAIHDEISAVADGQIALESSPLRHAPHTAVSLVEDWDRAYPRREGGFPPGVVAQSKYWPPVGRIDGAHGDRNLMCSCPPLEAYPS